MFLCPLFVVAQNADTIFMKDGHILCCTINKIENNLIYCTREFDSRIFDGTVNLEKVVKYTFGANSAVEPNKTYYVSKADSIIVILAKPDSIKNDSIKTNYKKPEKPKYPPYFPKYSIYGEMMGNGGTWSINQDILLFHKNRHGLSIRAGFSYVPGFIMETPHYADIAHLNYNIYLSKGFYLDMGAGLTNIRERFWEFNKYDLFEFSGSLGFRFIIKNHFLIRTVATFDVPAIYKNNPHPMLVPAISGGLSLGYCFGLPEYVSKKINFKDRNPKEGILKNSIFIEGLGSGIFYSINYERALYSKKFHAVNIRIGYSIFPDVWKYINTIPLLINFQNKITEKAIFETGLGARYVYSFFRQRNNSIPRYNPVNRVDIIGSIGVRFLLKKHFFIKTAFTPTIVNDNEILYGNGAGNICQFFSISMGYTWGQGKKGMH